MAEETLNGGNTIPGSVKTPRERLEEMMQRLAGQDICLAFSGGVDSSLLLKAAVDAAAQTGVKVYACLLYTSRYMDEALAENDLEASYRLWQKAQWDGVSGITQEGDIPWIWLVNIDHLYWAKDGLKVAQQKLHPHGHGWSIVNNVDEWSWE